MFVYLQSENIHASLSLSLCVCVCVFVCPLTPLVHMGRCRRANGQAHCLIYIYQIWHDKQT